MNDVEKLNGMVSGVLEKPTAPVVLVNVDVFFAQCKFSKMPRRVFESEVNDALSSTDLMVERGWWVFSEIEGKVYGFIRLLTVEQVKAAHPSLDEDSEDEESSLDEGGYRMLMTAGVAVQGVIPKL